MRNHLFVMVATLMLTACASTGANTETLLKTVSFDSNCAKDKIRILSQDDRPGSGQYLVDACGKKVKYKRTGTIYYRADKNPI